MAQQYGVLAIYLIRVSDFYDKSIASHYRIEKLSALK